MNAPRSRRNKCSVSSLRRLAINLCCTHHICGVSWYRGCRVERVPGFESTRVLNLTVCAVTIHGVANRLKLTNANRLILRGMKAATKTYQKIRLALMKEL